MRKKSHISLSRYLLTDLDTRVNSLKKHRGSFYLGSILPDISPSFLYRKHTIDCTFSLLQKKIGHLLLDLSDHKENRRRFWIRLGVVMHYLADYCTYPHNSVFPGTLSEHCHYERDLKFALRAYVRGDIPEQFQNSTLTDSENEIKDLISTLHTEYLKRANRPEADCTYIVELCRSVLNALLKKSYPIVGLSI